VKVLFDQNVPRPLARFLTSHEVTRLAELGWQELANGELIAAAETAGYDVLITADKNLRYQQNLADRRIAIIILPSGQWPIVKQQLAEVIVAVDTALAGEYKEIQPLL
jgi:predicted nuclease of predicted toxin-antitoxin system